MTTLHLIEAARARHSQEEMKHRRAAMLARISGKDPLPDEIARDHHHLAFVACQKELQGPPFVRRVE